MSEETEKLMQELCRMMMDTQLLLREHIRLSAPSTTERDVFLVGLQRAMESMTHRLQSMIDVLDKMNQQFPQIERRLQTLEDLVRPMHTFAYDILSKCPNCKRDPNGYPNDTRPSV